MLFSSVLFIFIFLPATLFLYHLLPSLRWKDGLLIVSSLIFYAWGEFQYTGVMLASILIAWGFGRLIMQSKTQSLKKTILTIGICLVLGLLLYFKYAHFICENISVIFNNSHLQNVCRNVHVHLPIGISFYTFQSISYLIDVYRNKTKAQSSLAKMALYKLFFPQLIAGPIVRYVDVAKDLENRLVKKDDLQIGAERFITGLAQKVLIANTVGRVADITFTSAGNSGLAIGVAWLGALCYFFQIYYDFCGYSNMAIGLGRMFGFHFLENFEHPYSSQSITEFWRRWHISLSSWFRDYLYIPLGGNRVTPARTYLNLYIVFALCGLWHGASWNFMIWGLFHGTLLVIERFGFGSMLDRLPRMMRTLYVWVLAIFGWVFFRSDTLAISKQYLKSLVGLANVSPTSPSFAALISPELGIALLIAAVFSFKITLKADSFVLQNMRAAAIIVLFFISLAYLSSSTYNPFIYFRF